MSESEAVPEEVDKISPRKNRKHDVLVCQQCGKGFEFFYRGSKFCSRQCYFDYKSVVASDKLASFKGKKSCSTCGIEKNFDQFSLHKGDVKPIAQCRGCIAAKTREWRKANADKKRETARKWRANNMDKALAAEAKTRERRRTRTKELRFIRLYGIDLEIYNELFSSQGNKCAICEQVDGKRLHVDHCHATGRVRGILCSTCNHMIGMAYDDPSILTRGAEYLSS